MEVVNARSALLSNYEVLTLLQELESDQLARTKTALRVKKEEEQAGDTHVKSHQPPEETVCENLRTVEFEAIQYLTAEYQPLHAQTPSSITQLVVDLAPHDLTKGEKLQIVNLAPTQPVELYVIVEELEDRLGDRMDGVLDAVRRSLNMLPSGTAPTQVTHSYGNVAEEIVFDEDQTAVWDGDAVYDEFVDVGEGAGVEGDLEMDDED